MPWLLRHRRFTLALVALLCTGAVIAAAMFPRIPFASSVWTNEIRFRDAVAQKARRTAVHPEFVFLGIDEPSKRVDQVSDEELASSPALQSMRNGYPWSRDVYAEILRRLGEAGARLVMFDVIFGAERPGDEEFARELERFRDRVVLGANIAPAEHAASGNSTFTIIPPSKSLTPAQLQDDRVGYANFFPDADGIVRRVSYSATDMQITPLLSAAEPAPAHEWDFVLESLDARALRKLGRGDAIPPPGRTRALRFSREEAYRPRPIYEVLVPATWERNFAKGAFFKDKIVIIGSSSAVDHDVVVTSINPNSPGPVMHLHALAAALDGEFIQETGVRTHLLLLVAAGVVAWVLVVFVRNPLAVLVGLLAASAGYVAAVLYMYDNQNLLVLTVPVLAVFNASGLFSLGYDFTVERVERVRTRRTLERYVSKNLVKEILDNPSGYYNTLKGARRPVTVLFSDLVGFTNLTERSDPEQLVSHLNELLSAMVKVVFENNGTLDKFIGDAIMAVWGNVRSEGPAADAKAAARTALGMRRALKELNDRWRTEGRMGLGMGMGINHGEAVVGNIGSYAPHERLDPTVIGDAVNLASRLEALTRTYGVDILVGEAAVELIRGDFDLRSVASVQVKGKTVPVSVSALLCAKGDDYDGEFLKRLELYENGLVRFRDRDFTQARILFAQFLEFYPNDYLAKMYLDRALEYEREAPDEHWTAAEVFTKK